jgi:hypothetical protein
MHDKIRQLIITKFDLRRKIGGNMNGMIIPSIIETFNDQSKAIKDHEVVKIRDGMAEVTVSNIRHAINLEQKSCTCRSWQVTGNPCSHALDFIATLSREIDMADFVNQYYSGDMFRKAYAGVFTPMTSKQLWKRGDVGCTIKKPQLRRKPGRARVSRIKVFHELGTIKKRECCNTPCYGCTNYHCYYLNHALNPLVNQVLIKLKEIIFISIQTINPSRGNSYFELQTLPHELSLSLGANGSPLFKFHPNYNFQEEILENYIEF